MIKRIFSLAATSSAVLGLAAAGAMGTTTALAGGGGGPTINVCSLQIVSSIVCVGVLNGSPITIDISNLANGNQIDLNVLTQDLNGALSNDKTLNDIATGTVEVLSNDLNVSVCQVKVIELGQTNTNIAQCN